MSTAGLSNTDIDNLWTGMVAASNANAERVRRETVAHYENLLTEKDSSSIPTPSSTSTTDPVSELARALAGLSLPSRESKLKLEPLDKFDGSSDQVERFISSVRRHVFSEPSKHLELGKTLLWILDAFTGDAERWAATHSELIINGSNPWTSLNNFYDALRLGFTSVTRKHEAQENLLQMKLKKGEKLDEFTRRFKTEAEVAGWDDEALISIFRGCLPSDAHLNILVLAGGKEPEEIGIWYEKAQLLSRAMISSGSKSSTPTPAPSSSTRPYHPAPRAHATAAPAPSSASVSTGTTTSDAMDVDAHKTQRPKVQCYNCGQFGHKKYRCPEPAKVRAARFDDNEIAQLRALLAPPLVPAKDFQPPQQ